MPAAAAASALMSPQQFAHSTTTPSDLDAEVDKGTEGAGGRRGAEPVGLSKEQLQQALLYLIKVGVDCSVLIALVCVCVCVCVCVSVCVC